MTKDKQILTKSTVLIDAMRKLNWDDATIRSVCETVLEGYKIADEARGKIVKH